MPVGASALPNAKVKQKCEPTVFGILTRVSFRACPDAVYGKPAYTCHLPNLCQLPSPANCRHQKILVLTGNHAGWHLASRLQVHARARRQPVAAQTISAANQRGMLETDTGGRFYPPYPVPGCASHSAGLFRKKPTWSKGATMRIIETMPGEPNSSMISSIINLVCPQCGGSMMEFQCCGKCRRNWLTEWEWAMRATGSSNVSSHPGSRRSAQE